MSLPQKAVEKFIDHPINQVIPIHPEEFSQAVNNARPIVLSYPDSPATQVFTKIAKQLQPVASA
jgi:MinD-like ATPase involved in chromosome partitioning or flagellar assembly